MKNGNLILQVIVSVGLIAIMLTLHGDDQADIKANKTEINILRDSIVSINTKMLTQQYEMREEFNNKLDLLLETIRSSEPWHYKRAEAKVNYRNHQDSVRADSTRRDTAP